MNNSIRWPLLAVVLGLCAAYALWGQRRAEAPGGDAPVQPVVDTPKVVRVEAVQPPEKAKSEHGATALKFEPDVVDFGSVPVNESRTVSLQISNPTTKPIKLSEFRPSCGCLHTDAKDFQLEPGASAPVSLRIAALPGSRKESVRLYFKTDEQPVGVVCLVDARVKVVEEISVEPNVLKFDMLEKNAPKTLETIVKSTDGKPFSIKTIACLRPEFTFKIEPLENSAGAAYKVLVTLTGKKGGLIAESVGVVTDRERAGTSPLHLSGTINLDLLCQPAVVNAQSDAERNVPAFTTVVKRKSPGKLEVLNVVEAGQGPANQPVSFDVERVDDSSCRLSISFKGPYTLNIPFGQFLIKTNVEEEDFRLPYRVNGLPARAK